ncbi:MAG: hypothetical protein PUB22_02685 [Clostridiales bacterium]|nr:hypothetical protein [Clostridiales bacterium]
MKMKQKWNKQNFCRGEWPKPAVFICLLFFAAVLGFFRDNTNVDEIWNFTFANNIANGLVPYRDFNLLQTPAACMINAVILKIFGSHLLVMRFMGAVLFAGIGTILYQGSCRLGGKGWFCWILPAAFLGFFYYNVFFEYSCLILFCLLFVLYHDMKGTVFTEKEEGWKWYSNPGRQIGLGALAGIAIMSKQTFGGFAAAASWISVFLISGWYEKGWGERLKMMVIRMLGSSIPCFAVLFYLLYHHAWGDFWDFCVTGISTFSAHYSFLEFLNDGWERRIPGCLWILLIAAGLAFGILRRKTVEGKQALLIMVYGIFGCVNLIPLANDYHVITCSIPFLWLVFPLGKRIQEWKVSQWVSRFALIAAAGAFLIGIPGYCLYNSQLSWEMSHLEGIFFQKSSWEDYLETEQAVEEQLALGHDVYILDNAAAWYLIPNDVYHKYLDMFLVGNLGTRTPEECLEDTLGKNAVYFLPESNRGQYQYPRKDVEAFREEWLAEIGEAGDFRLYREMKGQETEWTE